MSVKAWEKYQPNASSPSPQYPYGSLRKETALGMGDGTPLDVEWGNDFEAFKQTAFSRSGLVPSGNTDTVTNSEMFNAMQDSTTRSLWERSAAESGYKLVAGSFEEGGALVNANDVLWSKKLNKIFSGPAGTVTAGTNPASGGFVDRSQSSEAAVYATVAEVVGGKFPVGKRVTLTDRANATFIIMAGGAANGYSVLSAGSGNTAQIVLDSWMPYEAFGADPLGLVEADAAIAAAHATNHIFFYAKPGAVYLHTGVPAYMKSGTSIWLGNSKFKFKAGTYDKYLYIYKTNDDITYNPATPRVRDIKIIGGEVDGNIANVNINSPFGASALRAQCVDGVEWHNPKIYDMPGVAGSLPAIDFHFSTDCYVYSPNINNTDRQGIMFWESTGKVLGGSVKKSRFREPIIASSENTVAYQGSNMAVEGTILDNNGTTNGTHVIRFSGRSDGHVLRCKLYATSALNGVYVTFALPHDVTVEQCDIYNASRGIESDTTGDNKHVRSINNRFYDCARPLHAIFGGTRSSFTSKGDKCYGVTDKPFNIDFVPNVTVEDFSSEGGTSFAFINNYTKLDVDGVEISGNTAPSYSLSLGTRNGLMLATVRGVNLHDNTINVVTTASNILSQDNNVTSFSGSGLRLSKIGRAFIWATSAGVLYIKNTEPTNETDGTVVGAQA